MGHCSFFGFKHKTESHPATPSCRLRQRLFYFDEKSAHEVANFDGKNGLTILFGIFAASMRPERLPSGCPGT
jgi:hypothetical protein